MKALPHPVQVLQLAAVVTPPLAVIAPRGLAIVLPVAALAAAAGAWKRAGLRPPSAWPVVIIAAFLAWGAASAAWAIEPRLVWAIWGQIAGVSLAGLLLLGVAQGLDDEVRGSIGMASALGVIIALTLLLIEWISSQLFANSIGAMLYTRRPFHTYIFNRGAATLALLVWPAALAVQRRFRWQGAAALVGSTLIVVALFDSMAAILGIAGGALVWCIAGWRARPAALVLASGLTLGIMLAPLVPRIETVNGYAQQENGSVSIYHRLQIWSFVAGAIAERPVAGWGLNASREFPGVGGGNAANARKLPLHPHNAFLQLWLELGAIGAALGAALVLAATGGAARLPRQAQAAALALITGAVLVASVGYGIWQAWWMSALWLAAGLMVATAEPARPDFRWRGNARP